jgi:DNA replication initiation complex subunit (GINS family)
MLTYESLRRIRDAELSQRTGLSKLPEGFFESVRAFIDNKMRLTEGKEDRWEAENARMLLEDILRAREAKLLAGAAAMASAGEGPANAMPEEQRFLEAAAALVRGFRESRKAAEAIVGTVALLQDLPAFTGTDMMTYGPFKRGDIAAIPEDVAAALTEKGVARRIATADPGAAGDQENQDVAKHL